MAYHHKKTRRPSKIVLIEGDESLLSCDESTTVLKITNNSTYAVVKDVQNLTLLHLRNTRIMEIDNCPSLYSIDIDDNSRLTTVSSCSIREVKISNAYNLRTIEVPNAVSVSLDNLPILQRVVGPLVSSVSVKNMSIDPKHFNLLESFPNMKSLEVYNVTGTESYDFDEFHITHLYIENCDIKSLQNLENCHTVVVKNNINLRKISKLYEIENLSIIECDNLYKLENVFATSYLIIDRCCSLKTFNFIESNSVHISYCYNLSYIQTTYIDSLTIERCPSLTNVMLFDVTKLVNIYHCDLLESIDFDSGDAFCFASLVLNLEGDNNITSIKDWYVAELTIKNNPTVETICSIYNVNRLIVESCSNLYEVSDMVVLDYLLISNCISLESIAELYGIQHLSILECERLEYAQMYFTNIKSVVIGNCELVHISMNAESLESLILFDCGFINMYNLNETCVVNIANARLLPDINSNSEMYSTDLMNITTSKLIKHICTLNRLSHLIGRQAKSYLLRKRLSRYIEIKKREKNLECSICYDALSFHSTIFTVCNHLFHTDCLHRWFRERASCPLCNRDL